MDISCLSLGCVVARTLDITLRTLLRLLFLAAALHALVIGWTGLTFGLALWDAENPSPTVHWLAAIVFPILLFKLIPRRSIDPRRTVLVTVGACAFVVYYVLFYLSDGAVFRCGLRWFC